MADIGGYQIKNYEFTRAWGVNPSSATGVVIPGITGGGEFVSPVEEGDYVVYQFGALATFYGIVTSSEFVEEGVEGLVNRFVVLDNRIRLQWQVVTGAWNMPDDREASDLPRPVSPTGNTGSNTGGTVGDDDVNFGEVKVSLTPSASVGALSVPSDPQKDVRYYWHILPEHAAAGIRTWTTEPLSAREILNSAFAGAVGHKYAFTRSYHSAMNSVYPQGIDATDGVKLSSLISQINDVVGLDMKITGAKDLTWDRRGGGLPLLVPTLNTSPRRIGRSLTSNDTAVMVVGDENLAQVLNVSLEPDWKSPWEAFIDEVAWIREVARAFSLPTDTKAKRAELAARAREVTVYEYAKAVDDVSFLDYRPFGRVSRNDLEAWVYIRELVYRSYRIPLDYSWGGVPLGSLSLADRLLVATEIVGTGASAKMNYRADDKAFYVSSRLDAIGKGQPLDLIDGRSIHLFHTRRTRDLRTEWTVMNDFEVDAENFSIRFRSPVFIDGDPSLDKSIYSKVNAGQGGGPDVTGSVDEKSGYLDIVVPNPDYEITPAEIKVSPCWKLGKYRQVEGNGARYGILKVPGLAMHMIDMSGGATFADDHVDSVTGNPALLPDSGSVSLKQLKYASGDTAQDAASAAAVSVIELDAIQEDGSYTYRDGTTGTALTPMIDRVTLGIDEEGLYETVELTKARATSAFIAERTLARLQRSGELYAGQDALRREVESLRLEAKLQREMKSDRVSATHQAIDDIARKPIGAEYQSTAVYIDENGAAPEGGWKSGHLVWLDDEGLPSSAGQVFGGVVVKSQEEVDPEGGVKAVIQVAMDGTVPTRVRPGHDPSVAVGAEPGDVVAGDGWYPIGMLAHSDPVPGSGAFTYAMVRLGGGGGSSSGQCGFQYIRPVGGSDSDSDEGWEIVGGVIQGGPKPQGVDAHVLDLSTDGTYRYYLKGEVTVNSNDGVAWPGVESHTDFVWERVEASAGYPSGQVPTNEDLTVEVIIPCLKIKIENGSPTVEQREGPCSPVALVHCVGSLVTYGTPVLLAPSLVVDDSSDSE